MRARDGDAWDSPRIGLLARGVRAEHRAGIGQGARNARSSASDDELELVTGMSIDELEQKQENEVKAVAACVGAACAFGAFVGATQGADKASEYFAGYLLEQSLSVDNLFVFVLVFDYFKVPVARQNRVLNYGI